MEYVGLVELGMALFVLGSVWALNLSNRSRSGGGGGELSEEEERERSNLLIRLANRLEGQVHDEDTVKLERDGYTLTIDVPWKGNDGRWTITARRIAFAAHSTFSLSRSGAGAPLVSALVLEEASMADVFHRAVARPVLEQALLKIDDVNGLEIVKLDANARLHVRFNKKDGTTAEGLTLLDVVLKLVHALDNVASEIDDTRRLGRPDLAATGGTGGVPIAIPLKLD